MSENAQETTERGCDHARICRSYSRLSSLKKNGAFRAVYKKGRRFAARAIALYVAPNDTEEIRFGVAISKKCGNSVVRHRFTRIVREVFRRHKDAIKTGYDFVVVAQKGVSYAKAQEITYYNIEAELRGLLRRARVL